MTFSVFLSIMFFSVFSSSFYLISATKDYIELFFLSSLLPDILHAPSIAGYNFFWRLAGGISVDAKSWLLQKSPFCLSFADIPHLVALAHTIPC